jgi:uncharacterized YigZ family protein
LKTIKSNSNAEIIEKKSRFIANLIYVENEEEAISEIKELKKKYHDARHNCYAYRVIQEGTIIQRSSDDGEPSGTAGIPMLNILEKNNIINVLIVVTRYFGGILLGTGGLVKAYSEATIKAIEENILSEIEMGYEVEMIFPYTEIKKIEYFIKINNIVIIKKEYLEKIKILAEFSKKKLKNFSEELKKTEQKNIKYQIKKEKIISKND